MVGVQLSSLFTIRRTRLTLRTGAPLRITRARGVLTDLVMRTCSTGASLTCTAPPPMIAPPQVQAHSFAKAILTDISLCLSILPGRNDDVFPGPSAPEFTSHHHETSMQNPAMMAISLTLFGKQTQPIPRPRRNRLGLMSRSGTEIGRLPGREQFCRGQKNFALVRESHAGYRRAHGWVSVTICCVISTVLRANWRA